MQRRTLLGAVLVVATLATLTVACGTETAPEPEISQPQADFNASLAPADATVRFPPNRSTLTARERAELTDVSALLDANPGAQIVITGDAGPADINYRTTARRRALALARADAVRDYLAEFGHSFLAMETAVADRGPNPAAFIDPGAEVRGGALLYRRWDEIGDTPVDDFDFNAAADYAAHIAAARTPINICEECAFELSGSIVAPRTGGYRLWISADDEAALELSPDRSLGNATEIARLALNEWTPPEDFTVYAAQRSSVVRLQAGERYAIRARGRELFTADHIVLQWTPPGGRRQAIPQSALRPTP